MRVLLTGFGPFGKVIENPSGRIVEQIAREGLPGHELVTAVLPVSFAQLEQRIAELLREGNFDVALLLGVARKDGVIRLEQCGRNLDRARIPDCDGVQPQDVPVCADGPELHLSSVPLEPLTKILEGAGVPVRISDDAGGYVCNHLYYSALHAAEEAQLPTRCLFVHVPPDAQTFGSLEPETYMPFADQVKAVQIILEHLTGGPAQ